LGNPRGARGLCTTAVRRFSRTSREILALAARASPGRKDVGTRSLSWRRCSTSGVLSCPCDKHVGRNAGIAWQWVGMGRGGARGGEGG
jgi:hypothetical protein